MSFHESVLRIRALAAALWFAALAPLAAAQDAPAPDWQEDWEIRDGFSITSDSKGYDFPVQIAFVPDPGPGPDDPLYYVVQLRGTVKVVTNAREVRDFATVPAVSPTAELPDYYGEIGSAGICLAPDEGYVFVTFAYRDEGGVYRNNIARFQTEPGRFGLTTGDAVMFTEIFVQDSSALSHQIGPCQVRDGLLYVSVGDGERPLRSRDVTYTSGKILRMTLDGAPAPGNPFSRNPDSRATRDYVYALGFRNPFGLMVRGDLEFVADNGPQVDRFVKLEEGSDYLYDGSDWSIGARADILFSPAVSPVAFDRYSTDLGYFPEEYDGFFFLTLSGAPNAPLGIGENGTKSVVAFGYDVAAGHATTRPRPFLAYRGEGVQLPVGAAFGPDGLYIVPIMPDNTGTSRILRIAYDPDNAHPYDLTDLKKFVGKGRLLMQQKGCFSCHTQQQHVHSVGPNLRKAVLRPRLDERLTSEAYAERVAELNDRDDPFWQSYTEARNAVLAAPDEDRAQVWIRRFLAEPTFDNPDVAMPNLGLKREEIEIIADYLLWEAPVSFGDRLTETFGPSRHRYTLAALVLGVMAGAVLALGAVVLIRRLRA